MVELESPLILETSRVGQALLFGQCKSEERRSFLALVGGGGHHSWILCWCCAAPDLTGNMDERVAE